MKTPRKNLLPLITAVLLVSSGAYAATPLAFDNFEDYVSGTNIHGQTGGDDWAGAWQVRNTNVGGNPAAGTALVSADSITYNYGGVTLGGGNSLELTNASNGTQRDVFGAVDTSGGDFYVSLIFQYTGTVFAGFQAKDQYVDVGNDSIALVHQGNYAAARVDNTTGGTTTALTAGTTYFMVIQYTGWTEANPQYTTVNAWINPNTGDQSESSVSATYTDVSPDDGGGSSGFLGLYIRALEMGTAGERMLLDDLRIGTSWASVTAIPEPGSTALLAAGVATLFALTSRRRRA